MRIDYTKYNPAIQSIYENPNQIITLDANILIPPERGDCSFPLEQYKRIWIQPLQNAFPKLAIHEAVYEELVVLDSLEAIIKEAIYSNPKKLILHKDSDLSQYEVAIRNTIEARISPNTKYDPALDNKNDRGEVKSIAYIAAKGLLYFAAHDSIAIKLINNAEQLGTSLDSLFSIQPYEIIYYLYKLGYAEKKDMRMLYRYLYYSTQKDKKQNLEWGIYLKRMDKLYPSI